MTTFPSRLRAMLSSNSYFSLCPSHQLLLLPPLLSPLPPCNRVSCLPNNTNLYDAGRPPLPLLPS